MNSKCGSTAERMPEMRDSELATRIRVMQSSLSCTSWPHVFVFPERRARAAAFESLCKQSSRAATRVTRKMRAPRTIEPRLHPRS